MFIHFLASVVCVEKQILNLPVSVRCHERKKLPLLLSLKSIKGLVAQGRSDEY